MHKIDTLISEVDAEIRMRTAVYARQVQRRKMTENQAKKKIAMMQEIREILIGVKNIANLAALERLRVVSAYDPEPKLWSE